MRPHLRPLYAVCTRKRQCVRRSRRLMRCATATVSEAAMTSAYCVRLPREHAQVIRPRHGNFHRALMRSAAIAPRPTPSHLCCASRLLSSVSPPGKPAAMRSGTHRLLDTDLNPASVSHNLQNRWRLLVHSHRFFSGLRLGISQLRAPGKTAVRQQERCCCTCEHSQGSNSTSAWHLLCWSSPASEHGLVCIPCRSKRLVFVLRGVKAASGP